MDLMIVIFLVILTVVVFKKLSNTIYAICIIDIFLRIVDKIDQMLNIPEFSNLVNKYLPNSVLDIITTHTSGIINTVVVWLYIVIYIIFLFYLLKSFFKRA